VGPRASLGTNVLGTLYSVDMLLDYDRHLYHSTFLGRFGTLLRTRRLDLFAGV
jgi:hypothetical protein